MPYKDPEKAKAYYKSEERRIANRKAARKRRENMSEEEKEELKAKHRKYYKNNKEKFKIKSKKYRERDKKKYKKYRRKQGLKQRYGVTIEWWDIQFKKQKGCCAICGKHQSELNKTLYVDHNHKTGQVRGLLCMDCNFKVGQYESIDIELIKSYLDSNEK